MLNNENQLNNILEALNNVCAMKDDYLALLKQLAMNNPSILKNANKKLSKVVKAPPVLKV